MERRIGKERKRERDRETLDHKTIDNKESSTSYIRNGSILESSVRMYYSFFSFTKKDAVPSQSDVPQERSHLTPPFLPLAGEDLYILRYLQTEWPFLVDWQRRTDSSLNYTVPSQLYFFFLWC